MRWALQSVAEKLRQTIFTSTKTLSSGLECDQLRQTGTRSILHLGQGVTIPRQDGRQRGGEVGCNTTCSSSSTDSVLLSSDKAPTAPLLTPHTTDREAVSPAGYITGRSAVSAALDSAERRTAWPPGYATGAHVLAGCLPGHRSSAAELISTPTLSAVL